MHGGGHYPSNTSLTPQQMVEFQARQAAYYQQQQQQIQKQLQREEQRNRLLNVQVKTMGTPTFNMYTNRGFAPTRAAPNQQHLYQQQHLQQQQQQHLQQQQQQHLHHHHQHIHNQQQQQHIHNQQQQQHINHQQQQQHFHQQQHLHRQQDALFRQPTAGNAPLSTTQSMVPQQLVVPHQNFSSASQNFPTASQKLPGTSQTYQPTLGQSVIPNTFSSSFPVVSGSSLLQAMPNTSSLNGFGTVRLESSAGGNNNRGQASVEAFLLDGFHGSGMVGNRDTQEEEDFGDFNFVTATDTSSASEVTQKIESTAVLVGIGQPGPTHFGQTLSKNFSIFGKNQTSNVDANSDLLGKPQAISTTPGFFERNDSSNIDPGAFVQGQPKSIIPVVFGESNSSNANCTLEEQNHNGSDILSFSTESVQKDSFQNTKSGDLSSLGQQTFASPDDDFDDFASAADTTKSDAVIRQASPSLSLETMNDYVPGTLKNENEDVVYSVAAFSNPVEKASAAPVKSEYDKLIEKSLSGKASKSDPRALFRPQSKKAIPTIKVDAKESIQAANWSSLDLGDMFAAKKDVSDDLLGLFDDSDPTGTSNSIFEKPSTDSFNDMFAVEEEPPQKENIFSKFSSSSKYDSIPGVFISSDDVPSALIDDDWSDFTSKSVKAEPVAPLQPPDLLSTPKKYEFELSRLPKLYRDIIEYCNTPSDIIDVSKVYRVMLTSKFKITELQPLMSQCNMSAAPSPKDMAELIALVGMKQKGFPTPSKYEIDFRKPPLPTVNSSLLKSTATMISGNTSETLLSLASAGETPKLKQPQMSAVFNFGGGSNTDFSSKPIVSSESLATITSTQPQSEQDDEWGDFGEASQVVPSESINILDLNPAPSMPIPNFQNSAYKTAEPQKSISVFGANGSSKPPSFRSKPPPLDEPPPLSDEEEDSWAEFAHPSQKWDLDDELMEDTVQDNRATKNRWGNTSLPPASTRRQISDAAEKEQETGPDDASDEKSLTQPSDISQTSIWQPFQVSSPVCDTTNLPNSFVSSLQESKVSGTTVSFTQEGLSSNIDDVFANFELFKSTTPGDTYKPGDKASCEIIDSTSPELPPPMPTEVKNETVKLSKPMVNMDCLATVDDGDDEFANFYKNNSNNTNMFADFSSMSLVETKDESDFYNSPFANFMTADDSQNMDQVNMEKGEDTVSGDDEFDDFRTGTFQQKFDIKTLPSKDLDGFWNDMVDSLGPKTQATLPEERQKAEPVFAAFADLNQKEEKVEAAVSYDALKDDAPSSEEDKLGAWSKCLSVILTILIQCQNILEPLENSSSVLREVASSDKGANYIRSCIEAFQVACRISSSGSGEDGVVEIFKEIKHTWSGLAELLDGAFDLPSTRELNIPSPPDDLSSRETCCGVCLLDTCGIHDNQKLVYNGVWYHLTCANLWINAVSSVLPNLNPKLAKPLL